MMSNKYIPRMDEETLAFQLDEARKANCQCDQGCEGCPWALPNEKCLLLTAEHHISERYRMRFHNLKRHYRRVSEFLMNADCIRFGDYDISRIDDNEWILYKNRVDSHLLRDVKSALDLVKSVDEWRGEEG